MRSLFGLLYVVLTIISWVQSGDYSPISILVLLLSSALGFQYLSRIRGVKRDFCSIYVFIYLFFSHTIVLTFPAFFNVEKDYYQRFWLFVHILYIIFFFTSAVFRTKRVDQNIYRKVSVPVPQLYWNILVIGAFILSFISFSLGLSKMGTAQDVYLPFHLAGIINFTRLSVIPVMFAFFLSRTFDTGNKKSFKKYLIIYIAWLLVETFVRLSRGALIANIISLGIVFIMVGNVKIKNMIRVALPIALAALMLFPIVSSLRSITGDNKLTSADISKATQGNSGSFGDTMRDSFLRMFSTVSFYDRTYTLVDDSKFFDFRNAPIILALGGSHYFVTSEVDQRGLDEGHNSGSTGIIDSLLFGGYGFCYIVFFFSVLALLWLDSDRFVSRPFVRYVLYGIFIWFIRYRSVSFFIDSGVVEQLLVSGALLLFFIHYYNRHPNLLGKY